MRNAPTLASARGTPKKSKNYTKSIQSFWHHKVKLSLQVLYITFAL
ncbi:MAG: hypothetical protein NZ519_03575 [Bacteroidia bacterium]|nr:hypothetical protein [Bacteroidia bacterium]